MNIATHGFGPDTEEMLYRASPNTSIDPSWFAASSTGTVITATMPLGMDLRFCRGVSLQAGVSAMKEFTLTIRANEGSRYNLGQVHRNDAKLNIPTRSVTVPNTEVQLLGISYLPKFGRRKAGKVFLTRAGELLLTFTDVRF